MDALHSGSVDVANSHGDGVSHAEITNGHGNASNGISTTNGTIHGTTNGITNGTTNGYTNGYTNGATNGTTNGYTNGQHLESPSTNGHTANGVHTSGCPAYHDSHSSPKANGAGKEGMMPIAICGMACRLPGGLESPQDLWEFLLAKKNARGRVPESRYNISSFHSPTPKPGTISTEYGCFLDESVDLGALDTSFFSLPRTEVERADPQQRLMLEVSRECFEDAGVVNWRGKTIGCYIGNFGEDWVEMFAKEPQQWGMHRIVGTGDFVISNRLSYEFDLKGPSMTIRTGCSAALVCLNEACAAIQRGDCEAALVGGVNLILAPNMTIAMTEQGILSKDGACKSFSAEANGYARGEAATAIYVKPLADALRDGNPVRAVIRATSHNVDGKTPGLSQPSTDAQEALIRRAYQVAGIEDYGKTAMVECHGTGTPTGDPIEAKAVARVFGKEGVYIGSVKPNMGHTEGASGLVSLMKMVKSLEHRTIPPNIRFHTPNPNIPFKEAKLTVPVEPTSWPEGRYERISLNSFGVGGANAHVILESAATFNAALAEASGTPETPQLLLFTANSSASLGRLVENYKSWYEKHPDRAADLAYTLGRRREHLPYRAFAIAANGAIESTSTPSNVKGAQTPTAVMVFTGQGAQWPLMGRELLQSNAVFRSSIRALDVHLHGMAYSIEEELKKPPKKSRLSTAELAQPLCTAVQVALVDTLRSIGVVPDAVVGHSSGELAAAYAAGALTAAEAILAAHHRGAVTTLQKRKGAMAAIGMGWADTEKHLVDNTTIACDNSPKSVTISGDAGAVEAVVSDIKKTYPDVMARLLQVDKAYHSYHMAEIGEQYLSMIGSSIVGKDPVIPFFSSVTGALLTPERKLGAEYWRDNLQSPVRFNEAVSDILNHDVGKNAVFLEIGPHAALAGPLRQIFTQSSSPAPYVSAMTRNQNCATSFLAAVGKLHSLKVDIDLAALFPTGNCLPELPRYPWNHEDSYWYEPRVCKEWRHRAFPYHDLLGVKQPESTEIEPTWRNMFHLANVPWVRDHRVGEDIVFPFAGYIALVGEAVRQTADAGEGFSIRNMKVSMALVLNENKPTEMITSFRPHRLTDSLNSPWWDFTVSSYNGHVWTKHCTGEVSGLNSPLGPSRDTPALPRELNAKKYYKNMAAGGLDLGPCFQTLDAIRTSTQGSNQATSKVINGRNGDEPNYFIHPTVIDATIQIHGAAAVQGRMRQTKNWLPTSIGQISIQRCASDMVTTVTAKLSSNHSIIGGGWCTADGQTVLTVDGLRMSLADGALSSEIPDTHAAARHEWAPHIDFVDAGGLIRPSHGGGAEYLVLLEELGHLCLLSSKRSHAAAESETPHLQKYAAWLASEAPSTVKRLASALKSLDNEALSARIEQVLDALRETPAAAAATAIRQVRDGMGQLLSGQPLDSIVEDATLTGLYAFIDNYDTSQFLKTLRHSKPNLRVLEIGTGRGSAARDVIRGLTRDDGSILCSKYIFTSTGFISAKDHAQVFPNMDYATLDISQDPAEQGFADTQFDLIIATNALHTTRCLQTSLAGVKKLLAPDGRLLLRELCPASKWLNYVLGALPGWWAGAGDGRTEEPYIGVERWQAELAAAGLGSIDAVVLDAEAPHQLTASLIARHSARENHKAPKAISVLCERESIAATEQILSQLRLKGYEVSRCTLDGDQPSNPEADVIALLDLEKPFFESLDEARFQALKDFLHRLGERGLLWVTRNSHLGCRDPRYAQVVGLARVIRSELVAEFATCEVDEFDSDGQAAALVAEVFNKFQARKAVGGGSEQSLEPDYEWAVSSGRIQIGRFFPFALRDKLLLTQPGEKAELQVATPGRVNSLHWVRAPREDLKAGEVEVQDILVALGVVELPIRQFGLEAAGIVTRVGEGVDPSELAVGDRVFCLKKQAYSTYITTPTVFCTRIPDDLGFDEAASMLMPYVTALHGLVNVGRIAKGQRALIHSACGGVGLAAVQVCQMVGAELYCTVGSEEKAQFLEDVYQVPRHRIFNSRDQSFVGDVMRETSGEGMDIILNSLSGELLHATWACVAEFGTLVEIGKRDLIGGAKLDMNPFLANRSYCCIDIDQLWKKPVLLRKLILDTLRYYVEGKTTPVRPTTIFPASQTQDAFRFMQKGQHIGRVGISIPHNGAGLSPGEDTIAFPATPRLRPIAFDRNGSYLLVGGLGGLGRAISVWMAEHGAGELTYLSRSAGLQAQDEAFVAELRSLGCEVQMVRGDVNVRGDVERAVAAATRPLRGILQMSMVLRDQNFDSMTFAEWTAATAPKVQGTWNLHEATERAGARLDFMVLFSSLSGVIGQPGQANYASGNTFLDAFAQYRNSRGLAASVVDIGAVEGVGFISENHGLMSKMKTTGFKSIAEQELLDAMVVAMLAHPGGAATVVSPGGADPCFADPNSFVLGLGSSVPLTSPSNRAVWRKDRRMAAYHNAAQGDAAAAAGGASNAALKMFLAEALADAGLLRKPEAAQLLAREIGLKLFDLLLKPAEELNTSLALVDLGLDSLVALELRAWWKQVFAFDITVLEMLGMGSLDALGQHAAEGLLQVVAEGQEANGA